MNVKEGDIIEVLNIDCPESLSFAIPGKRYKVAMILGDEKIVIEHSTYPQKNQGTQILHSSQYMIYKRDGDKNL